ncbi:radical SAM protein [Candidatus Pacearchaeota archaeon]|nr:radical SAM protein [Candidatus Pacearchaeota archaeon]
MQDTVNYLKKSLGDDFGRLNDGYWAHVLKSPEIIEEVRKGRFNPDNNVAGTNSKEKITPSTDIVNQLKELNLERVRIGFQDGKIKKEEIFTELSRWEGIYELDKEPKKTFLGFRVTTDCNLKKRCAYCDQPRLKNLMNYFEWKKIVDEGTEKGTRRGIFVGISGGEPLMDGELLYGENGLIRYSADRGAIVNINSNAHFITPPVALNLIKSGLATMHVSLDSSEEEIHEALEGKGTFRRALEGIYSVQLAKAIFETEYPIVYVNTVATKENLLHFDKLVQFLFQRKFLIENNYSGGEKRKYPDLRNSIPRLLPLGGEKNESLRPGKKEWKQFITEVLPRAEKEWVDALNKNEIPERYHVSLADVCFFTNPFKQRGKRTVEDILEEFSDGEYSAGRVSEKCYAAPTQAYVAADGNVYPCGPMCNTGKAPPMGNVLREPLDKILKRSLAYSESELGAKNPNCDKCGGSVIQINYQVEEQIRKIADEIIEGK